MDFEDVKQIRVLDVLAVRYGIKARRKLGSIWANSRCPLPSHKPDDKGTPFAINVDENFWQCFSESCRKASGKKGGDVVNLVALKEGVSQFEAARLLESWFKKSARLPERKDQGQTATPLHRISDNTSSLESGKGFIKALDPWFDELFELTDEMKANEYWKRMRNGVKSKVLESFKNGKAAP